MIDSAREADPLAFHIGYGLVRIEDGKVDPDGAGKLCQSGLRFRIGAVVLEFVPCFPIGASNHHLKTAEGEHIFSATAALHDTPPEFRHHGSAVAVRAGKEHAFTMSRREAEAAVGCARLEQDRRPLRRRFAQMDGIDRKEAARVADGPDAVWPGIEALRPVTHHGIVVPASLPELVGHLHEFVGPIVAEIMGDLGRQPRATGGAVLEAGDDVPGDAALGEMVERREASGEEVGLLVGEVRRDAEPQVPGYGRHGGYDQHGVIDRQLDGVANRRIRAALIDIVDADHVGEEDTVELAALQRPRKLDPMIEIGIAGGSVARMGPHAMRDMAYRSHLEGIQPHLPGHGSRAGVRCQKGRLPARLMRFITRRSLLSKPSRPCSVA